MTQAPTPPTPPTRRRRHKITMVFDRSLTDEELTRLQQTSNAFAVRVAAAAGDHSDHVHGSHGDHSHHDQAPEPEDGGDLKA
jgi:hypothetical protein